MQYRTLPAEDSGFDSELDELVAMRGSIRPLVDHSSPADLLDTVLVVANVCEARTFTLSPEQPLAEWYQKTAMILRAALDLLAANPTGICPTQKLENPELYFTVPEQVH